MAVAPAQIVPIFGGGSGQTNHLEFVLFGSCLEENLPLLIERLRGISDPGSTAFKEHEMSFVQREKDTNRAVTLRVRRVLDTTDAPWHIRYIGHTEAELTKTCPTLVRKTIDSLCNSNDMMNFLKELGFRMEYEFVARGNVFAKGRLKVTVSQISKMKEVGRVDDGNLEPQTNSHLVELCAVVQQGTENPQALAKAIREFGDQLKPIVNMEKPTDY